MPLLTKGDFVDEIIPNQATTPIINHPPVTNQNFITSSSTGSAIFQHNRLNITAQGPQNYWYLPAVQHNVSLCVIDLSTQAAEVYVISDQFTGCEFHILSNQQFNLVAVLHVYRGFGATVAYNLAQGWQQVGVLRSANIMEYAERKLMKAGVFHTQALGSNWGVVAIDCSVNPANIQFQFVNVVPAGNGAGWQVRKVDDGLTPYPAPVPAVQATQTRRSSICIIS